METRAIYDTGKTPGIRPETLLEYIDGWEPPTPDEIREALRLADLTGSSAGNLVGVNGRTIRKWTGNERSIPYAAWRLILMKAGLVDATKEDQDSTFSYRETDR